LRGESWVCQPIGPAPAIGASSADSAGGPFSAVHFIATWQGDALVGEIDVCWHDRDRQHFWEPAPLQLQLSSDGDQLTGSWRHQTRNAGGDLTLTRVDPDPPAPEDFGLPRTNLAVHRYGARQVIRSDGTVASVDDEYIESTRDSDEVAPRDGTAASVDEESPLDTATDLRLVRHRGIDYTSRDERWITKPLSFVAPAAGTVYVYHDSPWNTIGLRLNTGDWLQFLHASAVSVQTGQRIEAGEVLGQTGATGTTTINLQVQAIDAQGDLLDPAWALDRARPGASHSSA
jgi:hypothetical protein